MKNFIQMFPLLTGELWILLQNFLIRRFLDPNDLYDLADELSDEINNFVIEKSEAATIELGYEQQEDFSCKYWR